MAKFADTDRKSRMTEMFLYPPAECFRHEVQQPWKPG